MKLLVFVRPPSIYHFILFQLLIRIPCIWFPAPFSSISLYLLPLYTITLTLLPPPPLLLPGPGPPLPTAFSYPRPWHPHRILAYTHNRLRNNLFCDSIVTLQNILTHLQKYCLLHLYIKWRLLKNPIHLPLWLPPSDISGYLVLNPPRAQPMQGVITHVYNPKISTAFTTAFKNTPNTLGLYPYLLSILAKWAQIYRDLRRLHKTDR